MDIERVIYLKVSGENIIWVKPLKNWRSTQLIIFPDFGAKILKIAHPVNYSCLTWSKGWFVHLAGSWSLPWPLPIRVFNMFNIIQSVLWDFGPKLYSRSSCSRNSCSRGSCSRSMNNLGKYSKFNMLQEHYLNVHCSRSIFRHAPGAPCILNMLLEHICFMLLEHCAFKYAPGAYLTYNITPDYSCSWSICSWSSCSWSSCSWSII